MAISTQYNFLSGSVIDNHQTAYLDIFGRMFSKEASSSTGIYLGFGKSRTEWGQSSLINFDTPSPSGGDIWYSNYIGSYNASGSDIVITSTGYFDLNSDPGFLDNWIEYRTVYIVSTNITATDYDLSSYDRIQYPTADNNPLYMAFMGENWCQIENLNPLYWEEINTKNNKKFYILPYNLDTSKALLINKKNNTQTPYNKFNVNIYYKTSSESDSIKLNTNAIKCQVTIKDELVIETLTYNEVTAHMDAFTNKNSNWEIRTTKGSILYKNLIFNAPTSSDTTRENSIFFEKSGQRYLLFNTEDPTFGKIVIKVLLDNNPAEEYAIWNESLAYESSIDTQVSDGNPAGLPLSYLKNPMIHNSLFDVRGMIRLTANDVWFTKELRSLSEKDYFDSISEKYSIFVETTRFEVSTNVHSGTLTQDADQNQDRIYLENDNNFVIGDVISIVENDIPVEYEVSDVGYDIGSCYIKLNKNLTSTIYATNTSVIYSKSTTTLSTITIAKTQNIKTALKYNMYNVMIDKIIPGGLYDSLSSDPSPTPDKYRQLFVCYSPTFYIKNNSAIHSIVVQLLIDYDKGLYPGEATFLAIVKAQTQLKFATIGEVRLYADTESELSYLCSDRIYQHDDLFSKTKHTYNLGYILYLANKSPLYRRHLNFENFKFLLF